MRKLTLHKPAGIGGPNKNGHTESRRNFTGFKMCLRAAIMVIQRLTYSSRTPMAIDYRLLRPGRGCRRSVCLSRHNRLVADLLQIIPELIISTLKRKIARFSIF